MDGLRVVVLAPVAFFHQQGLRLTRYWEEEEL